MKVIPRKLHAIIDLLLILILLSYPWLFLSQPYGTETMILLLAGLAQLCYSLLSKYELGIYKYMNFKNHLSIDFFVGLMLLTAPWLWGFGHRVMWPHIIIGGILMLLALCSKNKSIKISDQQEAITF
jgi:hypothetical protein